VVVVERMLAGEIETTVVSADPLDVVAQQVVANGGAERVARTT
jgi:Lhr-like helicase